MKRLLLMITFITSSMPNQFSILKQSKERYIYIYIYYNTRIVIICTAISEVVCNLHIAHQLMIQERENLSIKEVKYIGDRHKSYRNIEMIHNNHSWFSNYLQGWETKLSSY